MINIGDLKDLPKGQVVDPQYLKENGFIRGKHDLKVLGNGELKASLTVKAHAFSTGAKQKIEQVGGTVEILGGAA